MRVHVGTIALFFATTALSVPQHASAQDTAPEVRKGPTQIVTVTAQKREEVITEIPISIVAVSGEELENANIESVNELAEHIPNLSISSGISQPSTSSIGMRGLNTSGGNGGVDPSVGVYIDGVYIPRPQAVLRSLHDIQGVEILRGPQGTLYGRNTPVGALNINSRKPTHDFEAWGQSTFGVGGNMGMGIRSFAGGVNGSVVDDIAMRVLAYHDRDSGYLTNLSDGATNANTDFGGRVQALYTPTDDFDLLFSFDIDKTTTRCCSYEWIQVSPTTITAQNQLNALRPGGFRNRGQADPKDGVVDDDAELRNDTKSYGFSLRGDYDAFDHTITSITAYRRWHSVGQGQGDGQPAELIRGGNDLRDNSFSQELRITSPSDQFFEYIAGAYYYRFNTVNQTDLGFGVDSQYLPFFTNPGGGGAIGTQGIGLQTTDIYDAEGWAVAFFGQGTAHITDQFSITGGLRWSRDEKDADKSQPVRPTNAKLRTQLNATPGSFHAQESSLTWLANAKYFIIPDDLMVYFTTATGFKAPGINGSPDRAGGVPGVFDAENSINYEVGTKANLFDQRLRLNVSIYRTVIEDLQVTVRNLTGLGTFATNAGKLRSQGVEASLDAEPFDWLTLSGEMAYLDNNYIEFINGPCFSNKPADPSGYCDQTGRPNEKAPKWGGNLSGTVTLPVRNTGIETFTRLSWRYTGGQYLDSDLDPRSFQRAYDVWDISTGLRSEEDLNWELTLWVKNIFNERYYIDTADALAGALFNSNGNPNSFLGNISKPRTMGVNGKVRF